MSRSVISAAVLAAALFGAPASALPVQWTVADGGNGHWYEFVREWVPYSTALADAASRVYDGLTGYLATITSAEENTFVRSVADTQNPWGSGTTLLLALSDSGNQGTWSWQAGPEFGDTASYTNWYAWEPASWPGADYALMDGSGGWFAGNQYYNATYVVEYGAAAPAPIVPLPASGVLLASLIGAAAVAGHRLRHRTAA